MQVERLQNVILRESRKWKELQENFKKVHNIWKNDYKQQEETYQLLQDRNSNLHHIRCDTAQKVKLEMYNKFTTTNDIFRLGEFSDQINDSCCDIKNHLEMCNKLKQTNQSNLESVRAKLNEKRIINEEQLKLQKDDRTEYIKNCNIFASDQKSKSLELNNLIVDRNKISNNIKSLVSKEVEEVCEEEQKIKDIDQQKIKFQTEINQEKELWETTSMYIKKDAEETDRELTELNGIKETTRKKFEDIRQNIGENKKATEDQNNANETVFKENIALKYEFKYLQDKLLELQVIADKENNENLQNHGILERDVQVLNNNLHNKENILMEKKEIEKDFENDMKMLNADADKLKEKIKISNKHLNHLNTEKTDLITVNNAMLKAADLLTKDISSKADQVQALKNSICELEEKNSNCTLTCKNVSEKLRKEIEDNKTNAMIIKRDIDTAILKHKRFVENSDLDELNKFKTEKLRLEKDIELIEGSNEKIKDDIKQFSIKLESKTLECDILLRKIKTASELQISIHEELKPKPVSLDKITFGRKRQFDETSDSSFDESVPFYTRLMKKKNKKAKTPSLRMTQL